jgi:hypothetical protein
MSTATSQAPRARRTSQERPLRAFKLHRAVLRRLDAMPPDEFEQFCTMMEEGFERTGNPEAAAAFRVTAFEVCIARLPV